MKILITGALGHIGSGFAHSLVSGEYAEVHLLDNLYTQRYCSLFGLPSGINFRFHEADILDAGLQEIVRQVDAVIHLAAITDAAGSYDKKDLIEKINIEGTVHVAKACLRHRRKLFFPSTTSVYGSQSDKVDEECPESELRPQSPYAESKIESEKMLLLLKREGLEFIICRFGTIYGVSKGMRFHTAVNKFCWQAAAGQPLTVWKTAYEQKRPYLDLGDAVSAVKFILKRGLFDGEVYNVVTENHTVKDIVELLRNIKPSLDIKFVENRIMNQLSYEVSSAKFSSLGFCFKGRIENGIEQTMLLLAGLSCKKVKHAHP
jgi:nucleoside-diphosphate-sugar epimerase